MKKIKNLKNGMTIYANHRMEPYFTFVKKGKKTIEGRLRKGNYRRVKPNDQIVIWNEKETKKVEVRVKKIKIYKSFEEMLKNEAIKKILPGIKTIEKGIKIYRKFYTKKDEKKYGVVAIEVERI